MNLKISCWVSLLLFPVAALAEPSSVLLSGTTVSTGEVTVLRQASVLLDDGHTKIDAGLITMDQLGKQLECANGVTVTVSGHSMKSAHLTLTLEPGTRVFLMNPAGVNVRPAAEQITPDPLVLTLNLDLTRLGPAWTK